MPHGGERARRDGLSGSEVVKMKAREKLLTASTTAAGPAM